MKKALYDFYQFLKKPSLLKKQKDKSLLFATPTATIRISDKYVEFPLYLAGEADDRYGIAHGFSSREMLLRYLNSMYP